MVKLIAALIAAAALVAAAPAAADDLNAHVVNDKTPTSATQACVTPEKSGSDITGGYFIDGCTVRLTCEAETCKAEAYSVISNNAAYGIRVTMNSRMRKFAAGKDSVVGFVDKSCDQIDTCTIADESTLNRGESASVQCNGVRYSEDRLNTALACKVELSFEADEGPGAGPDPETMDPAYTPGAGMPEPYEYDETTPYGQDEEQFDGVGPTVLVQYRGMKRSKAVLRVTCPSSEQSCEGDLAIRLGRKTAASGVFALLGGQSRTLKIKLTGAKRRKVLAGAALRVQANAYDAVGQGLAQDLRFSL
jgi:hypothetical protein